MPTVDLRFPLRLASSVPSDHGYLLYAALSRVRPALHGAAWLGVHPLSGRLTGDDLLDLGDRASLRLRLPVERIADVLPLAGATLEIAGRAAVVGAPTVHALVPAVSLDARMVAIKLTQAPHRPNAALAREALDVEGFKVRYVAEIERQLAAIGVRKPFEIRGRRRLTVDGRQVVGFSVRVADLNAEESVRLQENGIGGKRRMGCGIFRPTRAH